MIITISYYQFSLAWMQFGLTNAVVPTFCNLQLSSMIFFQPYLVSKASLDLQMTSTLTWESFFFYQSFSSFLLIILQGKILIGESFIHSFIHYFEYIIIIITIIITTITTTTHRNWALGNTSLWWELIHGSIVHTLYMLRGRDWI